MNAENRNAENSDDNKNGTIYSQCIAGRSHKHMPNRVIIVRYQMGTHSIVYWIVLHRFV